MRNERQCPRCGSAFSSTKLGEYCPACLLSTTLEIEEPNGEPAFWEEAPEPKPPRRTFSHFEILDELGRGGMGVVYRARDLNTERIIALKVLQAHHLEVDDLVQRFRSEVRAVSSLDHPHVLPIHEVGEHDGIPFFSMKLTTGGSLAQSLGNYLGRPREAAQLLAKVSRGVQHAHERGILHRDLKPGNILLDAAGEPYVCDFGLAKWLEDDRHLTMTAAVLGTPHYIAPEQASGSKGLTTAVDIYSLGAILYELLTGRPPFVGGSVLETLVASQEKTPDRPSSLVKNVPRDLETICLKALQFDPANRYTSARAFAEDLECYLAGKPINARPVGATGQLWRWAKRNPMPALLVAALVVMVTVIAVGSTLAAIRIDHSRKLAVAAESEARAQLYDANLARAAASRVSGRAGQRYETLAAVRNAAEIRADEPLRNEAAAALALTDLRVDHTYETVSEGRPTRAIDPEGSLVIEGVEPHVVRVFNLRDQTEIARFTTPAHLGFLEFISYDGHKLVAVRHSSGAISVWDLERRALRFVIDDARTGARLPFLAHDCAFSPDSATLAVGTNSGVRLYSTTLGRETGRIEATGPFSCIAFSPDGTRLATGRASAAEIKIFDTARGSLEKTIPSEAPVYHLAWSPVSRRIAAGCADFKVRVFDTTGDRQSTTFTGHRQEVTQVLFTPDGNRLISTSRDMTIRVWSLTALVQEVTLAGFGGEPALAVSADGSRLFCTNYTKKLATVSLLLGDAVAASFHTGNNIGRATLIGGINFSPSGQRLATASFESVDVWDLAARTLVGSFPIDPGAEKSVRFLDDSTLLISSARSGLGRYVLNMRDQHATLTLEQNLDARQKFIFSNSQWTDRTLVALVSRDLGEISIRDLASNRELLQVHGLPGAWDVCISPDRALAAISFSLQSGSPKGKVEIWSLVKRSRVAELETDTAILVRFDRTSQRMFAGTQVWRTDDWQVITNEFPGKEPVFSHAASWGAATIYDNERVMIFQPGTLQPLVHLGSPVVPGTGFRLAVDEAGERLALQSADNSVVVWDIQKLRTELAALNLDWN